MKRVAVLSMLTVTLLLFVLGGTAWAAPPQSLQINGSGTVLTETTYQDPDTLEYYSVVTGTARVTVHAKSVGPPELVMVPYWDELQDMEFNHYQLESPAKGSVTITVDDPGISVSFTANVTSLYTPWLDVVPFGLLNVVFDTAGLPAAVNPAKNQIYISDGALDHVHLWFLGESLGTGSAYSPLQVVRGNFMVKGWTWPEPWL